MIFDRYIIIDRTLIAETTTCKRKAKRNMRKVVPFRKVKRLNEKLIFKLDCIQTIFIQKFCYKLLLILISSAIVNEKLTGARLLKLLLVGRALAFMAI